MVVGASSTLSRRRIACYFCLDGRSVLGSPKPIYFCSVLSYFLIKLLLVDKRLIKHCEFGFFRISRFFVNDNYRSEGQ